MENKVTQMTSEEFKATRETLKLTQGSSMRRIADYTPVTKGRDGTVTIIVIENGAVVYIATHQVDSKFAARAIAAQYNAKPRNF